MEKIRIVFQALIGYAGSSENPEKMSLRLMGIVTAAFGTFLPVIFPLLTSVIHLPPGVTIDANNNGLLPLLQSLTYVTASAMWVIGAFRAVIVGLKTA